MKKIWLLLNEFEYERRKILYAMKLSVIFILFFSFSVSARVIAQQEKVSLDLSKATLQTLFREIQKQTGVYFVYNEEQCGHFGEVNVRVQGETVERVLDEVFRSKNFNYHFEDKIIVIKASAPALPQVKSRTITGKVADPKGSPLPGVTIMLEGTSIGVTSDANGMYALKCPEVNNLVLQFSFVGMRPVKISVGTKSLINVTLEEDTQNMDEVVVTGLLTRKKSGFAGASTVISKQELAKVSTGNIFTTISTLDAGFKINENNLDGSNPNKIPDFTIRGKGSFQNGSTAPIFILDGFEVSAQKIFDMDINRIESITLLKDASATILYGSRASNGVIVIETVAPAPGKLRVTYDFKPTIGIVDLTGYDLMNAREKLQYEKEADLYYVEIEPGYEDYYRNEQHNLDLKYNERYQNIVEGVDTYWLSQPIETSFSHAHSLFVEGGVDNVRYGIDVAYNKNKGVMKGSGRDRVGLGFSLIYRIKEKVTVKNYISYNHTNAYNSPYGSYVQYGLLNPYEKIYNENGELQPKLSDESTNPLYDVMLPNRDFSKNQEFREQLSIDWNITDALRLKGQLGITKANINGEKYKSPFCAEYLTSTYNSTTKLPEYLPVAKRGSLAMNDGGSFGYNGNITLNYNTVIDSRHIVYAGIGCEVNQSDNNSHGFVLTGFPDDRYSDPAFAIQFKENSKASSSETKSRSIGFFANGNYIYDDRYFVDLSIRVDGSSKFGADKRFAPFWSAGCGWNIHNEKLFEGARISMLKLRYSYGVTGNQEFSAYQAQTMFQFNTDRLYNSSISAGLMGYGNPELKWQNQYQSNIGLDFGYAKDRIRMQLNYYYKKTQGMLTSVTVAPSLGLPSNNFTSNLGEIVNSGFEANVNAILIRNQEEDLEWSVMLQAANNRNKINKISKSLKTINEKNNENKTVPGSVYEEGESMSAIKAVRSLGIDPTTGRELFAKKDGSITYNWNAADKVICGDSEPKVFGNFGTNVFYKGWNLNMVFKYNFDADYYNSTLAARVEGANPALNADRRVLNDRWKKPGQHALYKNIKDYKTTYISSRFIQKENTVQLTNISLSYDMKKEWVRKCGLDNLRLSFYMNDVFRVSSVKNERGLDYPFQRSYVFGMNVSF